MLAGGAAAVLRGCTIAAAEIHVPVDIDGRRRDGGVAVGAGRAQGADCRAAARRQEGGWSSSRSATPSCRVSRPLRRRAPPRTSRRSRRCSGVLALPALPRRIECFDISTHSGQRDRRLAGRVRRRPDGEGRIPEVPGLGSRVRGSGTSGRNSETEASGTRRAGFVPSPRARPEPRAPVSRRFRRHGAGGAAALSPSVLEAGGPFPDLIVIDGGKGQLSAAYEALGARRAGEPGGRRPGQEGGAGVHARLRSSRSRWIRTDRRCCCCSGSATKRTASPSRFHRQARTRRDLRSELDAMPASGRAGAARC